MTVSKSSFIDEPTLTKTLPALRMLSENLRIKFPPVNNYNLTYLRKGANQGVVSEDDNSAPIFAFWHKGLGRSAAVTTEIDGKYTGKDMKSWVKFPDFFGSLSQWLIKSDVPDWLAITAHREGKKGIVRIEIEPEYSAKVKKMVLRIVPPYGDESKTAPFTWYDENNLEAVFNLEKTGVYRLAVDLGKHKGERLSIRAPSLALSYAPEFESRWGLPSGATTLDQLKDLTGGKERVSIGEHIFEKPENADSWRHLWRIFALLLIFFSLLELANRRLQLIPEFKKRKKAKKPGKEKGKRKAKVMVKGGKDSGKTFEPEDEMTSEETEEDEAEEAHAPEEEKVAKEMKSAFNKAKSKARKKF